MGKFLQGALKQAEKGRDLFWLRHQKLGQYMKK